jgi:hypothetical protein
MKIKLALIAAAIAFLPFPPVVSDTFTPPYTFNGDTYTVWEDGSISDQDGNLVQSVSH